MTRDERDEVDRAIAKHLPGLPDGAVIWDRYGAAITVRGLTFDVEPPGAGGAPAWNTFGLPGHPTADSADAILAAVRAHFVAALATARADVAAYERALWPPCKWCAGTGRRRPADKFECLVCHGTRIWTPEAEASTAGALLATVQTFDDPDVSAVFDALNE